MSDEGIKWSGKHRGGLSGGGGGGGPVGKPVRSGKQTTVNKGLILETSAFKFLYNGQFTLSTQLLNPNFFVSLPHRLSTTISLETNPLFAGEPYSY